MSAIKISWRYRYPALLTGIAVSAASPFPLHPDSRDCNRRMELCSVSDAAYLPDEPAPEHGPRLTTTPPVVSSSDSGPAVHHLRAVDLITGAPLLGAPELTAIST